MRQTDVKIRDLIRGKRTVRGMARNVRQGRRANMKRIIVFPFLGIIQKEMIHKKVIVRNIPIDAIGTGIFHILFWGIRKNGSDASRTVLNDTEEVNVMRTASALTTNLKLVAVPSGGPVLRIFIDLRQEKMMKEPNMSRNGRVETAVCL